MPDAILSDEYYEDVQDTFGLYDDPTFVEQILYEAKTEYDSPIWGYIREGDYHELVEHMESKGYDIPDNVQEQYLNDDNYDIDDEFKDEVFIPDEPYTGDQSFYTGAEFAGSMQIVEKETDKIYIPSSYYCHTKVYNKFLELQGRGKDIIPLEAKGINPYAMKKSAFLNHIMKYIIKCDCISVNGEKRCKSECFSTKRKLYEDRKNGNKYYKENSTTSPQDKNNFENYCKPSICRVWVEDETVQIKTINKAKQSHPKMCIGLVALKGTGNCHAVLIKDYNKITKEDITIHLSKTKELYPGFKKFKKYMYRDPKPYAVSWDIETWVIYLRHVCKSCKNNGDQKCTCKYSYKLNVAAIGYEIINIVERSIIQPCKIVFDPAIKEDDETTLFDMFFTQLNKDCKKYGITDINMYAHNSAKFDSGFAKKSTVIKFDNEISTGNNIKSLKLKIEQDDHKLKLSLLDTLPFTLQSLKDACATFKTEICKEEFDIINKSRKWYVMNSSEEMHKKIMNSNKLKTDYINHYMDMHMKCEHNVVLTKVNNKLSCNKKYARIAIDAKQKELEDIKTYKDWKKYLSFDVRSLSNLIFNVDAMYNEFGFSITNYVGLPGVAMDMMNSYCYNLSKLYVPSDPSMVELCKASIIGGRILHYKDKWDSPVKARWDDDSKVFRNIITNEIEDQQYEDFLISLDKNSLYPSMMYAAGFPLGKPELVKNLDEFNKHPHYIGEFEVTIPNIRYPLHPYRTEKGAIIYPSNQTIIGVYNDVDIREMIFDGYQVKMRKGIYWKKSGKIFSELLKMIYDKRNYYKSLNPDDPEYSKEYICKILMNSMFGKFNETIRSMVRYFSGEEDELEKTITKKSRVKKMVNGQYRIAETLKTPRISKPTYIAGYITAYSRALCNELFRKIGPENIYYSDTDSVYIRYSTYKEKNLICTNGLCGFKNDYGDGVMITKARFLDIKRCYFEFQTKVESECFDKWGRHRASCKDPITKEVNKDKPYYAKTFKFKYTGINFKDIVKSSTFEPDNKLYSNTRSLEEYNKIMDNTSKIVDKFIKNNLKSINRNEYDNIKFMMKRFKKDGHNVTINMSEYAFVVTPEKRGQWINKGDGMSYYALGYDFNKPEVYLNQDGKIGDLVEKHSKYIKCDFGYINTKDSKYLRSRRPLFYNIRMHIEIIKEKSKSKPKRLISNDKYIKEYNNAEDKPDYVQKIFDEYLKSNDKQYVTFLNGLMMAYITPDIKPYIDNLIHNDIIYDKSKLFDTDYYIEFFDEIPENVKYQDYNKKYRIISKQIKYNKNSEKTYDYFIPNFINVKSRTEVNQDKLYPLYMISTRFNNDLGRNNLENWQAIALIKNIK